MTDVTFGVKMPEELKQQIDNLIKDSGLRTSKDFMQSLINSYILEKTKESIPEVAEDLKELQILTQRIDNIYLNLGYRIENITKAQQEEQQNLLNKKESIILDLQSKIEIAKNDKETITEAYNNTINQSNEYLQRVNELTESNNNIKALNEEYKNKVDTITGILEEYKTFKTENEALKVLMTTQQTDNIKLQDLIKDKSFTITNLNNEIERLTMKHNEELKSVKEKAISDLKTATDTADLNKSKEILSLKEQYQERTEKKQDEYNNKISQYQDKHEELLKKLEELEQSKTKKATSKDKQSDIKI